MAYKVGKSGSVTVGAFVLPVKSWTADHKVDKLDVSSTGTSGFRAFQGGLEVVDVEIEADWDATSYPYAAAGPNLVPGTSIAVTLKTDSGQTAYTITTLYVESVNVKGPVEGTISYTVKGSSSGSFTHAS